MTLSDIRSRCSSSYTFYQSRNLAQNGGVKGVRSMGSRIFAKVLGETPWAAKMGQSALCGCSCDHCSGERELCVHAAALLIWLDENGAPGWEAAKTQEDALTFLAHFESRGLTPEAVLRLAPTVSVSRGRVDVSLRVGVTRLYIVKDIALFLDSIARRRSLTFGKGLTYDPAVHGFSTRDQKLIAILRDADAYEAVSGDARRARLSPHQARQFLLTLGGSDFTLELEEREYKAVCQLRPPDISFELAREGDGVALVSNAPPIAALLEDASFVFLPDTSQVCFVPDKRRAVVRALLDRAGEKGARWLFSREHAQRLVSEALPQLCETARLSVEPELDGMLIRRPLDAHVFLDRERSGVSVRVEFRYGEIIIAAFSNLPELDGRYIVRDVAGEREILQTLERHMFTVKPGYALLEGDEAVYEFLTRGVPELQKAAAVFASEAFAALKPKKTTPSARLSARGTGMFATLALELEGVDERELAGVLEAIREKRSWVRLSDGAFVALDIDPAWLPVLTETSGQPEAELPRARALALGVLAEKAGLSLTLDESAQAERERYALACEPTDGLKNILRPYQKRGFEWMWAMADLGLGGVLADDMGLGKTVEVIALIDKAREDKGAMPSLVVAPTSVLHNWVSELERFAPGLAVVPVEGSPPERRALLQTEGVDVFIASYAQLRRDETLFDDNRFRFIILDEAQQVKNAFSVGARAVRRIEAESRFALTGTPMENHPGELWAVFDFVLPGLLGGLQDFMSAHGRGQDADIVRQRIRPFIMRRLKSEVLAELPERIDHVVEVDLPEEQMEVYRATLLKARQSIEEEFGPDGGGHKSRFALLAALTRLRQACCHPSLYIENYRGPSGKADVLVNLLEECRENGHRALVFSQFTSMLGIIRDRLEGIGISHFYLDGKTPSRERMDMVNAFNAGERGAFLLSLKAGGVGLNLTGADTVVLFDPWWNPAVEDQASDRAHRIGQTRAVHVLRLVARGTVEEKVMGLKEGKRELIEKLITSGEVDTADISPADLYQLLLD